MPKLWLRARHKPPLDVVSSKDDEGDRDVLDGLSAAKLGKAVFFRDEPKEEAAAADQLSPVFSPRDLDRPPGCAPASRPKAHFAPPAEPPQVDSTLTLGPNAGSASSSRPRRNSVAPARFVEIRFEPYKRSDRGQERPARSSNLAPMSPALRQALGPCVRSGWSQVGWQSLLQEHTLAEPPTAGGPQAAR